MLSEPEVYNLKHWRGLPDRSRGSKNAPAFKYKLEFCRYINKAPRLSDATKRIGRAIVEHYNEARGCAWPSNRYLSEELDKDETTIRRATNLLHERGLIHKTVGGGWDRGKVRHKANQYYPAFALITNPTTGALVENAPYLYLESSETRSNTGKYPGGSPGTPFVQGVNHDNRQSSAEVPRPDAPPRSDNVVASAIASPISPDGSNGSLASPESTTRP